MVQRRINGRKPNIILQLALPMKYNLKWGEKGVKGAFRPIGGSDYTRSITVGSDNDWPLIKGAWGSQAYPFLEKWLGPHYIITHITLKKHKREKKKSGCSSHILG